VVFGDAQDADQLVTGLGGQSFIQTASQSTAAHGDPSSAYSERTLTHTQM
jgi:hypothetical protein